jgi:phosphopantetheine adenylyltransferase
MTVQEIFEQFVLPSVSFTKIDKVFLQRELPRIKRRYDQWHRAYHNWSHIENLLCQFGLVDNRMLHLKGERRIYEPDIPVMFDSYSDTHAAIFLTILYHDVVYNPIADDGISERLSVIFFLKSIQELDDSNSFIARVAHHVVEAIKDTTPSFEPITPLGKVVRYADQRFLFSPISIAHQVEIGKMIQYEYRHIPFEEFLEGRNKFLDGWLVKNKISFDNMGIIRQGQKILAQQRPTVGVFVLDGGVFHMGHWSVVKKAMRMFNRILILVRTSDRLFESSPIDTLEHLRKRFPILNIWSQRQNILLYLDKLKRYETPVLIRAIRNQKDLEYEINRIDTLQESLDECQIYPSVFIPVDAKFRHLNQKLVSFVFSKDKERFEDIIPSMADLGYTQEEIDEMLLGDFDVIGDSLDS